MATMVSVPLTESEQAFLDTIIAEQSGRPGALLTILEKAQERQPRKFLSRDTLEYIAAKTGAPLSRIFGVVTFYGLFNLDPQGENTICVCRGTACHTRGSRDLLERLMLNLGFHNSSEEPADKISLTTKDGKYTIRTVACFGQCALAPVVELNHAVFGHMNEQTLERELEQLERETAKK
jgi:NADH-quinone oxidoreductase subunit E